MLKFIAIISNDKFRNRFDFNLSLAQDDKRNFNVGRARKRIVEYFFPNAKKVRLEHRDRSHIGNIEKVLFEKENRRIDKDFTGT